MTDVPSSRIYLYRYIILYIIHLNIQCCYLDIACFRRSSAKWLWFFSLTVWAVFTALVLLEVLPNLCLRSFLSRRTCTAAAFCGTTHLDMKPWPAWSTAESHVAQEQVFDKPSILNLCIVPDCTEQRKGFAASCRSLWIFLDMVTLISNWLLRAPLLTLFYCYVSVCQTAHGMGTSCCQVGSASYSAMTLWRQPATAL